MPINNDGTYSAPGGPTPQTPVASSPDTNTSGAFMNGVYVPPSARQQAAPGPDYSGDITGGDPQAAAANQSSAAVAMARGAIKGVGSLPIMGANVSQAAIDFVMRHGFGMNENDIQAAHKYNPAPTSENIESGLSSIGLKPQPGQEGVEAGTELATGLLLPGGGGVKSAAQNLGKYSGLAGPDSIVNRQLLNVAAAADIGVPGATKLTSPVLNAAQQNAKAMLNVGRKTNNIILQSPETTTSDLLQLGSNLANRTGDIGSYINHPAVKDLWTVMQRGYTDTRSLGDQASFIGTAAKKAMTDGDHALGTALYNTKDYTEGLISSTLNPQEQAIYDKGRQIYRTLNGQLLADASHINPTTGDVNGRAVSRFLQNNDTNGYTLGQNKTPMYEALRNVQGSMGVDSGADAATLAARSVGIGHTVMRAARMIPGAAQVIQAKGIRPAIQMLANKPGFMGALSNELSAGGDDGTNNVPNGPSSNP